MRNIDVQVSTNFEPSEREVPGPRFELVPSHQIRMRYSVEALVTPEEGRRLHSLGATEQGLAAFLAMVIPGWIQQTMCVEPKYCHGVTTPEEFTPAQMAERLYTAMPLQVRGGWDWAHISDESRRYWIDLVRHMLGSPAPTGIPSRGISPADWPPRG